MKKTLKIILLFLVTAMFLGGCNMQNKFLYFPEPMWPTAQMLEYEKLKLWQATADDFIRLCASQSHTTGNPYMIKFADGNIIPAEIFLRQKLKEYSSSTKK